MKPTERFSDRVSNYLAYRPSYPAELIDTLAHKCSLHSGSVIADVGSGTGKLSELLLEQECSVIGVEPNTEMREAAVKLLNTYQNFKSVDGECTDTRLEDHSVDLITVAQAFHWFEPIPTKKEFERILKPDGYVALIWNKRNMDLPFHKDYDHMLHRYCPEYAKVNHHNITDGDISAFANANPVQNFNCSYTQKFDLAGFIGRMCSSSYTPKAGSDKYAALVNAAQALFEEHESGGVVEFAYQTNLFLLQMH